MKSQFEGTPLLGNCEGADCGDECPVFNVPLYSVHGGWIKEDQRHEYYYCDHCVKVDEESGFTVELIDE